MSRTPSTRLRICVAAVAALALLAVPASSVAMNNQHQPRSVATAAPVSIALADRAAQAQPASRSYPRGNGCPDGSAENCVSPTPSASPTVAPPPPPPPPPAPPKATTAKPKPKSDPGPATNAGGGSGCAPAVSLPASVVAIVSNYLSGCNRSALLWIIYHESGGNVHDTNPTSGAYGIPQALPGSKMASAGPDWRDNPDTQIRWMIGYVNSRYGGPQQAYHFWVSHHWY